MIKAPTAVRPNPPTSPAAFLLNFATTIHVPIIHKKSVPDRKSDKKFDGIIGTIKRPPTPNKASIIPPTTTMRGILLVSSVSEVPRKP